MAQERTITKTWILVGEPCRRLRSCVYYGKFEGRLKVQAHRHRLGRTHRRITVYRTFSSMRA
jgi:hypothetical protein